MRHPTAKEGIVAALYRRFFGSSGYRIGEHLRKIRLSIIAQGCSLCTKRSAMKLNEGIQEYLRKSRLDGRPHEAAELTLTAFCKQTGNVVLEDVTTQHIKLFLDHPNRSSNTWRTKHSIVRRFFEFWSLRAAIAELVM